MLAELLASLGGAACTGDEWMAVHTWVVACQSMGGRHWLVDTRVHDGNHTTTYLRAWAAVRRSVGLMTSSESMNALATAETSRQSSSKYCVAQPGTHAVSARFGQPWLSSQPTKVRAAYLILPSTHSINDSAVVVTEERWVPGEMTQRWGIIHTGPHRDHVPA